MTNATPFMQFLRQASAIALIVLTLAMVAGGILGLVYGRLRIGPYKLQGTKLRILSALVLLSAAAYFIPRYALPVELGLLVIIGIIGYFLAEKPKIGPAPACRNAYLSICARRTGLPPAPAPDEGRSRYPHR